jgi:cell division protein FtsQ
MSRKITFKVAGLLLILTTITVSLSFTSAERKQLLCQDITVYIEEEHHFITPESVERLVKRKFNKLSGTRLDTLNTEIIENAVEKLAWVKNAEVFKGYSRTDSTYLYGGLRIHIEQEVPIMRVVDGEQGFYVNENGKHMPFSSTHSVNVPVITGHISDRYINEDLINFVRFISEDKFWKAFIQQIHIRENNEYVLVPRVGEQLIVFGKPEKLELRFRNLEALLKKGFDSESWAKYRTITLKYDNQVVCTLR